MLGSSVDINKHGRGDFGGHGLFMSGLSYLKIIYLLLANNGKLFKPMTIDDISQYHLSPEVTAGH